MTIPEWDLSSPALAKWLNEFMKEQEVSTSLLAAAMEIEEQLLRGYLAAEDRTSEEAIVWGLNFTFGVCEVLNVDPQTIQKVVTGTPEWQARSRRYHERKAQQKEKKEEED